MIRELVRIGSLRQLILFSFFLALLPLLILLWQTQQSLSSMAQIADGQARSAVDLTRDIELLQKHSVDLERLVRQYQIVNQDVLRQQIAKRLDQIALTLQSSCQSERFTQDCETIRSLLDQLDENNTEATQGYFSQLNQALAKLETNSRNWLDARLEQQRQRVELTQSRVAWQTLALLLITLLMVWGASQLLLGPIQALGGLVNAIGGQQKSLPATGFQYPRELSQLDTRLRWLAHRLQELESVRHAMLRHASHELKTPLASMIEGSSLLADEVVGELNSEQKEVVSLLQSSVLRLSDLVEELLDYNRLLQEAEARPSLLDTEGLLAQICESHQLNATQQNMQLKAESTIPQLWADKNLLTRILDNLINNAIAYGTPGKPIEVKVWQEQTNQFIRVTNAHLQQGSLDTQSLLEPFARGQQQRNDGLKGSGLGLAIVSDCVRMMQGKIELVGAGSGNFTVLISLPSKAQEETQ